MTDTPLHGLTLNFNSKPRYDVQGAVQGAHKINLALAQNHIIQEAPSNQENITKTVFEKLTLVNEITEKSATSAYLNSLNVQKTAEMQALKTQLNGLVTSRDNDEIINDLIGG